jgi:hypothetical protein
MKRPIASVKTLLGLVLGCAVFLAALRTGTSLWFKALYSLVFTLLVYAAVAARYRGAYWYGFAVAGWAYFLLGYGPWFAAGPDHHPNRLVNRNLISSVLLEVVSHGIEDAPGPTPLGSDPASIFVPWEDRVANRNGVLHTGLTLVFAALGGVAGREIARR